MTNGTVTNAIWTPNDERLAYRASLESAGTFELYTALSNGSQNTKVNGALLLGDEVAEGFKWSPDSSYLAYIANDGDGNNNSELFAAKPNGSSHVKVSAPLALERNVFRFSWE